MTKSMRALTAGLVGSFMFIALFFCLGYVFGISGVGIGFYAGLTVAAIAAVLVSIVWFTAGITLWVLRGK